MIKGVTYGDGGLPRIAWEEKLAHGSVGMSFVLWGAGIIILICGMIGGATGGPGGFFFGCFIGAGGFAPFLLKDALSNKQAMEQPHYKKEPGSAAVERDASNNMMFTWTREDGKRSVPLADINTFEFGENEHWFGDANDAGKHHKYFVVIAATSSGIKQIAAHSGSKADVAHLHSVLTSEFITKRKNFVVRPSSAKPVTPKPAALKPSPEAPVAATSPGASWAQPSWGGTTFGAPSSAPRPGSGKPQRL